MASSKTLTPEDKQQLERHNHWYRQSVDRLNELLKINAPHGLSTEEARRRQETFGPNELPKADPVPLWTIILRQFANPLIYILMAAAAVSLAVGEYKEALFVGIVIVFNAALGAYQEGKAEKSAHALQKVLEVHANIIRDGEQYKLDAVELVPGDIVLLESGQNVPADCRLIEVNNLHVNESMLTGESHAVTKNTETPDATEDENLPLADQTNMVFAGTTVTEGRGKAVVISTGLKTELGTIARNVSQKEQTKTPLIHRMEAFTSKLSYIAIGLIVAIMAFAYFSGMDMRDTFFVAIALAVSAIPEGLPIAMTVVLSVAKERMAKRNVVVRKLAAVEGLGSCSLIASDKTGTLTQNKQTLDCFVFPDELTLNRQTEATGSPRYFQPAESNPIELDAYRSTLEWCMKVGVLCNTATLTRSGEEGSQGGEGDPIDVAFLLWAHHWGLEVKALRNSVTEVDAIPYESQLGLAATFFKEQESGQQLVAVKGATDKLLPLCDRTHTHQGQQQPLDAERVTRQMEALSSRGYRVLALASGYCDSVESSKQAILNQQPAGLTLLGLVGFMDPLRPEVKDAINFCHGAGIKVVMITGDHPATALAIASDLNIGSEQKQLTTGSALRSVEVGEGQDVPDEFVEEVSEKSIFARMSPVQKLTLVNAFKKAKHFVAVTGDGVNDAPALREANIGVAMGSGTDVTKNTASIIVTDDNFASIVAGVQEGRFAYDNIRKVIYFLIATAVAEIILVTAALVMKMPLPLTALQILWLNLITSSIQDIALAFEAGEEQSLKRPPRSSSEGLFNRTMITQCLISGSVMGVICLGVFIYLMNTNVELGAARNLVLLLLVLFENFQTFNVRSETTSVFKIPLSRNWLLVGGVIAAQGLHILSMHLPFMQSILEVQPVDAQGWVYLLLVASSILLVSEIYKVFRRKQENL